MSAFEPGPEEGAPEEWDDSRSTAKTVADGEKGGGGVSLVSFGVRPTSSA